MTNKIKNSAIIILMFITAYSCKKNNVVIDKMITPPAFAKFSTLKPSDSIGTYVVSSINSVFKLPVGVTTVVAGDRTINFTYTSRTAVSGVQYNAPTSLVIKGGTALDTLVVSGLYSGYSDPLRKDTVKISITGGDVLPTIYKNNYFVIMKKG